MTEKSENRPKQRRVPATAWRPGISGNPGGRPAVAQEIKELARDHGPRAIERLRELAESSNEAVAVRAAAELLDRGYGRPAQSLAVSQEHVTVILDPSCGGRVPLEPTVIKALPTRQ